MHQADVRISYCPVRMHIMTANVATIDTMQHARKRMPLMTPFAHLFRIRFQAAAEGTPAKATTTIPK